MIDYWLFTISVVCAAFGLGILAGMSLQWRRDRAHVERLEAERDYLRVEVADLTDGDWVYEMEASVDKYLTRQFVDMYREGRGLGE